VERWRPEGPGLARIRTESQRSPQRLSPFHQHREQRETSGCVCSARSANDAVETTDLPPKSPSHMCRSAAAPAQTCATGPSQHTATLPVARRGIFPDGPSKERTRSTGCSAFPEGHRVGASVRGSHGPRSESPWPPCLCRALHEISAHGRGATLRGCIQVLEPWPIWHRLTPGSTRHPAIRMRNDTEKTVLAVARRCRALPFAWPVWASEPGGRRPACSWRSLQRAVRMKSSPHAIRVHCS
jgi:hypothetical protein